VNHAALAKFSRDDLIALVLAQHAQITAQPEQVSALSARLAELEAKLAAPPKTPDNSSLPPSKGQKPNLPDPAKKKPRPSRPGVARALAEDPDLTIEATLDACPHCQHTLGPADQPEIRLAGALSQLGRLMKTLHILRYIQEEPLRDAIQLQFNRGEFRPVLAKSVFFANWGNFRSGDYEEVMNKASCLSLLSSAVLV
jgi:Tn3 transposase DDE domain